MDLLFCALTDLFKSNQLSLNFIILGRLPNFPGSPLGKVIWKTLFLCATHVPPPSSFCRIRSRNHMCHTLLNDKSSRFLRFHLCTHLFGWVCVNWALIIGGRSQILFKPSHVYQKVPKANISSERIRVSKAHMCTSRSSLNRPKLVG